MTNTAAYGAVFLPKWKVRLCIKLSEWSILHCELTFRTAKFLQKKKNKIKRKNSYDNEVQKSIVNFYSADMTQIFLIYVTANIKQHIMRLSATIEHEEQATFKQQKKKKKKKKKKNTHIYHVHSKGIVFEFAYE